MSERSAAAPLQIPDHTLLRVIGRGSYGEVWLARNVMGTQRAVKIVRRAAFDSDRPWLREFEGIRRCEPVSRAHDGLIDILHMGRNEAEGFFYYVMELADAAGDGEYMPATLSARLHAGKALDISDCLRLGESLAGALAFLHEQGLIHRDVKPSNVLYVGGVPKLGDIGLVAEAGSSRSFVGTEGFVPLEGPGTERADIYALGKVLYEALTGQDRERFPRLPAWWADDAEFDQRVELNEIVLRACEGDPARRYHTAREMLSDVALVASGRSVKKLRGMERRLKTLRWAGLGGALVTVLALGASWLVRQQADRERDLRVRADAQRLRAESAEEAARESQLQALLSLIRSARHDSATGSVVRALETASKAAAMRATPQLRNDVTFLLGRQDFVLRDDLKFTFTHPGWAIDADRLLMAELPYLRDSETPLTITLHTAGAPEKRRELKFPGAPPRLSFIEFSRDGKRLLLSSLYGEGCVLDVATGEMLHPAFFPHGYPKGTPLTFCGEQGEAVTRRATDGGLAIYKIPGGERRTTPVLEWPHREQEDPPRRVWPSPDGRSVLLIDNKLKLPANNPSNITGAACLVETETGRVVWKVPGPVEQVAAWSRDGTRIAVRHSDFIVCLEAENGRPANHVPKRIRNFGTQMTFLGSRDLLAYTTWSMTGLCDLAREEVLGLPPVTERWNYGYTSGLLMGGTGTAEWKPSPVLRKLQPALSNNSPVFLSFSPDEKWLVAGQGAWFNWWNLEEPGTVPATLTATRTAEARTAAHVVFTPDNKSMQLLTDKGRHLMPWNGHPVESLPQPVPYGPVKADRSDYVSVSGDGKTVAFGGRDYVIVHREGAAPRALPCSDTTHPVNVSHDGTFLAVGSHLAEDLLIFDLTSSSDEPVRKIKCKSGNYGIFSPDRHWFVCSDFPENRIFETGTWTVVHSRPRQGSYLIGHLSFDAQGHLLSVMDSMSRCAILEPGTWRVLYQLDSPVEEIFERNGLSPSGRYFAAVGTRQEIYLWDLEALQRGLSELGLGGPLRSEGKNTGE